MTEIVRKRRMKLASYITISITTIVFFTLAWILASFSENSTTWGIVISIVFIVLIFQLISISIKMVISSIKRLISFKQEKGLWKTLTLIFGICLVVFSSLISIMSLIWIIEVIKNVLFHFSGDGFDSWIINVIYYAKIYICSPGVWASQYDLFVSMLFISIFIFILIWSAGGVAYEILKKILGGNRIKKQQEE